MPDTLAGRKPPADRILNVTVRRVIPAGLIVSLPDGREGLIRERELAWDAATREGWSERYQPGDKVQAVFLGKGRERRPELSVRLAQSNCWANIEGRYPIGRLVNGVVTGIVPYGVFVELEAGVTGLLHRSRFPSWTQHSSADLFWPGDWVKVIIHSVEEERHRIGLSMVDLQARRWRDKTPTEKRRQVPVTEEPKTNVARLTLDMLFSRTPVSVLVVEDDPAQRQSVIEWLHYAGQRAEGVASAEEALDSIFSAQPDIVLMDVGLPGMTGIEGTHRIKAEWPAMRCTLMTDWSRAEHYAQELRQLRNAGVSLLIKPLLPEDLLNALSEAPGTPASQPTQLSPTRSTLEQTGPPLVRAEQGELNEVISRLSGTTCADKIVVFEFDPEGRQIKLLAHRGAIPLRIEFLSELIHSPVRDVAEDGKIVYARNAQETADRRFLHLKPFLDFDACLGVPVPAQLRNRYALFLFFARPLLAPEGALSRAEGAAATIGAWLERRHFVKQTADLNRVAVLGQLGRALVHEISGRLTPINLTLERLQTGCEWVEQCATTSPERVMAETRQARQELQTLAQQAQSLVKMMRSFSRMTRPGEEEIVLLEDIVGDTIEVLRDTAMTAHVKVAPQPAPRLFFTRAQVTYLQQVLVNILQNAIQQIHLAHPEQEGRVDIRLAQSPREDKQMLQVQVEDDGPGIHHRLWERVFEMDYTTRPDGSGLGLYMSRNLIESLGGRIYVADSHMLWGTTFIIELPYRM